MYSKNCLSICNKRNSVAYKFRLVAVCLDAGRRKKRTRQQKVVASGGRRSTHISSQTATLRAGCVHNGAVIPDAFVWYNAPMQDFMVQPLSLNRWSKTSEYNTCPCNLNAVYVYTTLLISRLILAHKLCPFWSRVGLRSITNLTPKRQSITKTTKQTVPH